MGEIPYRRWFVLFAICIGCAADVWAARPRDIEKWLDRTRQIESRGHCEAVGDNGRSRGPYQIQRGPWRAYGGPGPWHVYAHRERDARKVAAKILRACERACIRDRRPVTWRNVRWYYRHGGF